MTYDEIVQLGRGNLGLIHLTDNLRMIFDEITKLMAALIPLHDFVLKGFLWRAIKKWLVDHNRPIVLIHQMKKFEQIKVGIEILESTKKFLSRALYIPDKRLKKQYLDEIFRRTAELYEELLSVWTFINNPINQEYLVDLKIGI